METDAGIHPPQQQVRHPVQHLKQHGIKQHHAHHHGVVATEEAVDEKGPGPGDLEEVLDDKGTGQEAVS